MNIEFSEGFRKTIADILDLCVKGGTDSCVIEVEVKKGSSLDKNVTVTVTVTYQNNIGDEELVFTTKITK